MCGLRKKILLMEDSFYKIGGSTVSQQTYEQTTNERYVTCVSVATVWTEPLSARRIDALALHNPAHVDQWVKQLDDTEKLALCVENRIQTQLLYGEQVLVTEWAGDWAHVIIPTQPSHKDRRGYPGWVPACQLKQISNQDWLQPIGAIVRSPFASLTIHNESSIHLSYLTILPVKRHHGSTTSVVTPHGIGYVHTQDIELFSKADGIVRSNGESIVAIAKSYIGLDYLWGGMSAYGYDCSGLAYAAHKANGYQIARDAGDQVKGGVKVPLDRILPGDLLFFAYQNGKGRIHHVGIYSGNGDMLHAPQTGKGIEQISLANTMYETELCAARRYWQEEETIENGKSNSRSKPSEEIF